MHTCLHLLSAVLPYPVTGGQVSEDKGRLDFDIPEAVLDKDAIARKLNALIAADHQVGQRWITDEELAAQPDLVKTMAVKPPTGHGKVRLVEVALRAGARDARLIDDAGHVDWSWLDGVSTLGITAGASAPERLIEELIEAVRMRFDARVIEDTGERETVTFKLPRVLTT